MSVYLMTKVCLGPMDRAGKNLLSKVYYDPRVRGLYQVDQTVFVGVRVEQTLILSYL